MFIFSIGLPQHFARKYMNILTVCNNNMDKFYCFELTLEVKKTPPVDRSNTA